MDFIRVATATPLKRKDAEDYENKREGLVAGKLQ